MKGLMKKSINRPGTARWVINKTLKESFSEVALCGLSSLGQSNLFMLLPHPCYLCIHSFRSPDKRGLIVNKAERLTELGHLRRTKPSHVLRFDKPEAS